MMLKTGTCTTSTPRRRCNHERREPIVKGGRPAKTGASDAPVSKPTLASAGIDKHLAKRARKMAQAKGICGLLSEVGWNEPAAESASAAEALIEGVEKALDELRDIEHGHNPKKAPEEGQV